MSYASPVAFTGSFAPTSSQFIGPINYQNGFAVGFDGPIFGVTQRTNAVNTFTPQSQFNGDKLDGTGPSQFTYNPALLNVFRIRYGYLGSTVILFQIMTTYGAWITFHTIQYPNTASTPSIFQPFLPITARVENLTGTSVLTLQTASWNGGIIGQPNNNSYRYYQANSQNSLIIRNATVFNNQPNNIMVRCSGVGGSPMNLLNNISISLIKNGTITGTSFTNIDPINSVVQISVTTGTYTAGTGTQVFYTFINSLANLGVQDLAPDSYVVTIAPGETLTVIANQIGSNTPAGYIIGIAWEEQF